MKCDFCDNKARVFLTQLIEGQMKKVCLCDSCATEKGVTDPTGFSLADLLHGNPVAPVATSAVVKSRPGGGKCCPACGFSIEELHKVRRFGCGECYIAFAGEVAQLVRGMHKGMAHLGKVPAGLMARKIHNQRMEDLQARLASAIASESYEEAADLRDEIRRLGAGSKMEEVRP